MELNGTRAMAGEEGEERRGDMVEHGRHGHVHAMLGLALGLLCCGERERGPGDQVGSSGAVGLGQTLFQIVFWI